MNEELQHVSNAIDFWRKRALNAEAEIDALKAAAADDVEDEREACALICDEMADAAALTKGVNEVNYAVFTTASSLAWRIRNRGRDL